MSSLSPYAALTVPTGTGLVNAVALDAVLAQLTGQLNAVIVAMEVIREGRGRFKAGTVSARQLSDECNTLLTGIIQLIVDLRKQYADNYDPRQQITTPPTSYDTSDVVTFALGQAAPSPAFSAPMTLDGILGKQYAMTLRLRSVARKATIAPNLPFALNTENRIVVSSSNAVEGSETVGVTWPDKTLSINAVVDPFYFVVKTDNAGATANDQFALPLVAVGAYSMEVDWGDGTLSYITAWNDAAATHTYPVAGTYTIKISGLCREWSFGQTVTKDPKKILDITHWGSLDIGVLKEDAFKGCTSLTVITADDAPDFSNTTSTGGMFDGCTALTDITNSALWDVSGITEMRRMFQDTLVLNVDLSAWDVTSVLNFFKAFSGSGFNNASILAWDMSQCPSASYMFEESTFNQPIGVWDLSSMISIGGMFARNTVFNQPLNGWNTASFKSMPQLFLSATAFNQPLDQWDTSQVTRFDEVFKGATAFNQDLSTWDTSAGTTLKEMFRSATAFKRADTLANWDVTQVTTMANMFLNDDINNPNSAANQNNLNAVFIGWAAQNVKLNVPFHAGTASKYTIATSGAARTVLLGKGWTIISGAGV